MAYQQVQCLFWEAVDSLDHHNIAVSICTCVNKYSNLKIFVRTSYSIFLCFLMLNYDMIFYKLLVLIAFFKKTCGLTEYFLYVESFHSSTSSYIKSSYTYTMNS